MDPITIIIGALVAGSSAALQETASTAVKDIYQGLKTAVINHWQKRNGVDDEKLEQEASVLIENFENDPETFLAPLEKKIAVAIPNPPKDLVEKATELNKVLEELGFNTNIYNVTINNSQGVQIGDKNVQNNTF